MYCMSKLSSYGTLRCAEVSWPSSVLHFEPLAIELYPLRLGLVADLLVADGSDGECGYEGLAQKVRIL